MEKAMNRKNQNLRNVAKEFEQSPFAALTG